MGSRSVEFKQRADIYGVRVKKSESDPERRVEFVESAKGMVPIQVNQETGEVTYNGWDKTWIFDKYYPVMLKTNGTEAYKLNPNDYSLAAAGGKSDISDFNYDGNAMVHIDCYYSRYYEEDDYEYYLISDKQVEGFIPMGFTRSDGSVMKHNYISMYFCTEYKDKLRSIISTAVSDQRTTEQFRTYAHNNNENYHILTFSFFNNLTTLTLILFKNENFKKALGEGRGYTGGHWNSLDLNLGVLKDSGPIGYDPATKAIKFMHIEDFYSGFYTHIDGIYKTDDYKIYIKWAPPYMDSTTTNPEEKDYLMVMDYPDSNGWPYVKSSLASNEFGRIPNVGGGSITTYQCAQLMLRYSRCYIYNTWFKSYDCNSLSDKSNLTPSRLTYTPPK